MVWEIIVLIVGLLILVKGADVMVTSASQAARILHIPAFIVGLFIVALGTSAPEAVIGVYSGLRGTNLIAMGDVIGSSIVNIALIIGLTAVVAPIVVDSQVPRREIALSIGIQLLLAGMLFTSNRLDRYEAAILIVGMFIFVGYIISKTKQLFNREKPDDELEEHLFELLESEEVIVPNGHGLNGMVYRIRHSERVRQLLKIAPRFVLGVAGLIFGAELAVDNAAALAHDLGMSEELIGLTIISFGTSLPELVAGLIAVFKKEDDIAVGNIIGSNIMNILLVLGLSASINPIQLNGTAIFFDVAVMLGASLLLFVPTCRYNRVSKLSGGIFISYYLIYLIIKIHTILL